jgi:ATP-dependent DNA helicase 2 subunit 1
MSLWENIFQEEDEEAEAHADEEQQSFSSKDSLIFLIDCQPAMFEVNDRGEIPFRNAIKCAIATLTDKIISSDSDLLGVCFYGTKEKQNPNDFEGLYVFMNLDIPDAQKIIDLETILKSEEFTYGHSEKEFPFCDALWTCSTMFSLCNVKVGHRRIFLFTNDDNPNAGDVAVRDRSLQRAKDLGELGIDIELFSMSKPGKQFDVKLFYQNIISIPEDEEGGAINFDASDKFEELISRVRRKEFKKRSMLKLPLSIGNNINISVRVYSLVHPTKKGGFVWLDPKTNQNVKTTTKWVCEDTGTLLMDSQIKFAHMYGGEKIIFDKDEIAAIKSFDAQGLKLMGFKPKSALKVYFNLRNALFIYPDENTTKGSTLAFATLLDRMLVLEKIAICRVIPRVNSAPRFVALLPQAEELDEDGSQMTPPGFHLIYLPYADDIRELTIEPVTKASQEQIVKAKKLVKSLRIKFDSRNFENPALQKHYAAIQALALERENVEDVPDYVHPDLEGMEKFSELMENFKSSVFPEDYEPSAKPVKAKATKKRKAEANDDEPVKKKGEKKPLLH